MSKEVAKKTSDVPANIDYSKYVEGAAKVESLTSQIVIPRLSVVQKMSPVFEQGKAKVGDLFDYGTQEVFTPHGQHFDFIPVFSRMVKPEEKMVENRWEKTGKVTILTARNEKEKWDYELDGVPHRARPEFQVYMFSPTQLERIEESVPYLMTFRGMSMKMGGKTLYTAILVTQQKYPCFARQYSLKTVFDQEGKDTWYYSHVEPKSGPVDPKYFDALFHWNRSLSELADTYLVVGEEDFSEPAPSTNGTQNNQY